MAQWPAGQYLKVKGKNPLKMVFFGSSGHRDDPPGRLSPDLAPFADQDLAGGALIPLKVCEAVRVAALAIAIVAGVPGAVRRGGRHSDRIRVFLDLDVDDEFGIGNAHLGALIFVPGATILREGPPTCHGRLLFLYSHSTSRRFKRRL